MNIADRRRGSDRPGRRPATRLQQWLDANGFTSVQLEKASGIARQSMTKIRAGADTRKRTMLRILAAARSLKGAEVQIADLFDLEPEKLGKRVAAEDRRSAERVEALYGDYGPLLTHIARRKFNVPAADCEVLLQETLMSFLTTDGLIRDAKAWLIGAICNASRHYWRAHHRRMQIEEGACDASAVSDDVSVERLERVIHVRAMLDRLAPRKRAVLRLHYYEGFTAAEIARIQGTSPRYAQRLISKALRDLRSMHQVPPLSRKE